MSCQISPPWLEIWACKARGLFWNHLEDLVDLGTQIGVSGMWSQGKCASPTSRLTENLTGACLLIRWHFCGMQDEGWGIKWWFTNPDLEISLSLPRFKWQDRNTCKWEQIKVLLPNQLGNYMLAGSCTTSVSHKKSWHTLLVRLIRCTPCSIR